MSSPGIIPQQIPRPTLLARDLGPWQPDIDARKSEKPCIITGRNFRDGIDGPFSGWSAEFFDYKLWDNSTRIKFQELRLDTIPDIWYGTPTGVYRVDKITREVYQMIPVSVTKTFWPWTVAYVGGKYYFAQYDIGLWQYDPANQEISKLVTPNGNTVRFVIENNGRLCLFTDTVIANSALDDGSDFVPDLATGAGAQALSIGGGIPYRMESISDGILVFNAGGIIKGNYTTAAYVYSYKGKFSQAVKLFSANASCYVAGLGIVTIDPNGLFLTKEYNYETMGYPQPWEIEKSDYIKKNIIQFMDKTKQGCIGMYYSQSLQVLFIYFSSNVQEGSFQTTLCYEIVSKRWGSFDAQHYGIFETYNAATNTYNAAYMDVNGYIRNFSQTNFTEDYPTLPYTFLEYGFRPRLTDPTSLIYVNSAINDGDPVEHLFCEILGSDNQPLWYSAFNASGPYDINSAPFSDTINDAQNDPVPVFGPIIEIGTYINCDYSGVIEKFALVYLTPEIGLDSFIEVGPLRYNDQQVAAEETSGVESLLLGMKSSDDFVIYEDWNTIVGEEDWNSLNSVEDWGQGSQAPNVYSVTLRDTDDGFSSPFYGDEDLPVYADNGSSQLFKPLGNSSIYHIFTISAEEVGEMYALKTIDTTLLPTGIFQNA